MGPGLQWHVVVLGLGGQTAGVESLAAWDAISREQGDLKHS
jgi:hypothetical protein